MSKELVTTRATRANQWVWGDGVVVYRFIKLPFSSFSFCLLRPIKLIKETIDWLWLVHLMVMPTQASCAVMLNLVFLINSFAITKIRAIQFNWAWGIFVFVYYRRGVGYVGINGATPSCYRGNAALTLTNVPINCSQQLCPLSCISGRAFVSRESLPRETGVLVRFIHCTLAVGS